MTRTTILIIVLALAVGCVVAVAVVSVHSQGRAADETAPQPQGAAEVRDVPPPETYGLPPKLQGLTDLTPLHERSDLTAQQRTNILIWWLVRERADPSPRTVGLGGGDIDTGYIQRQLVMALRGLGDPKGLTALVQSHAISDPVVRDGVVCALGMMGDASRIPRLLEVLETHAEGDYRALAAYALGSSLGVLEARDALSKALQDSFTRPAGNCTRGLYLAYPVREIAQGSLRALSSETALAAAQRRREAFVRAIGPTETEA